MTELQSLYFSADQPKESAKQKSTGNKVSTVKAKGDQIKKLAEAGTKKISEKVGKLAAKATKSTRSEYQTLAAGSETSSITSTKKRQKKKQRTDLEGGDEKLLQADES